jgi:hypothetical protein
MPMRNKRERKSSVRRESIDHERRRGDGMQVYHVLELWFASSLVLSLLVVVVVVVFVVSAPAAGAPRGFRMWVYAGGSSMVSCMLSPSSASPASSCWMILTGRNCAGPNGLFRVCVEPLVVPPIPRPFGSGVPDRRKSVDVAVCDDCRRSRS